MTSWLLAAILLVSPYIAPAQTTAGASISGVVLSDDATPAPIRHARVRLNGPAERSVITGDDGAFSFIGLPAGRYEIVADKLGFGRRAFSANRLSTSPTPIALAIGQQMSALKVILPRGGVITGVISDPFGLPLEGATVTAVDTVGPAAAAKRIALVRATTDDEGRYRLYGLTPGTYLVRAEQDRQPLIETYYPGVNAPRDASAVTVGASDERLDISFPVRISPGVVISGTVLDADGQLADVQIRAVRVGLGADDTERQIMARGGEFTVGGIPPGTYELETRRGATAASVTIDVATENVTDVSLVLRPAAPARSAGDSGGLRGRISNSAGQAAPELAIVVLNADREKWASPAGRPVVIWPDTNGDWSIDALAPGDYLVAALGAVNDADLSRADFLAALAAGSVTVGVKAGEISVQDLKIR